MAALRERRAAEQQARAAEQAHLAAERERLGLVRLSLDVDVTVANALDVVAQLNGLTTAETLREITYWWLRAHGTPPPSAAPVRHEPSAVQRTTPHPERITTT